jgi:hypothetical protein
MLLEFLSSLLLFCWSYCSIVEILAVDLSFFNFFFRSVVVLLVLLSDRLLIGWCYCQIGCCFPLFKFLSLITLLLCFVGVLLLACCLLCCVVSVSVDWSVIVLYFESCFSRSVVEGPVVSLSVVSVLVVLTIVDYYCWSSLG